MRMKKLTKKTSLGLAVAGLLLSASAAQAHHSFAIYDLDNPIEITGTLTKIQFRNPHTMLAVEVDGEETAVMWDIESMNPRRWDAAGVPRDLAAVGDIVTIKGWPAVSGGKTMALGTVTSPSGTTVVRDRIRQGEREDRSSGGNRSMGR